MVAEVRAGKSMRAVARSYHTDPGTVSRTKRRWDQHHNNASRPRKWRPKKLTAIQIIRIRTLQRHLHRYWRRKWRSKKRILLTGENAKERLQHAKYWIRRINDYLVICFSDECTVQNAPNNPDGWVFRRPDEKFRR
ncbi:hypothetical protein B0T10DRAFT_412749, partial [Thelonectria olida]